MACFLSFSFSVLQILPYDSLRVYIEPSSKKTHTHWFPLWDRSVSVRFLSDCHKIVNGFLVVTVKQVDVVVNDCLEEVDGIFFDRIVFIDQVHDSTDISFWLLQSRHI